MGPLRYLPPAKAEAHYFRQIVNQAIAVAS